jgi:hypothetical protein
MSDGLSAESEDRFASLIALEALGLLPERLSDEVRMHLRTCEAYLTEYREWRRISDALGPAAQSGDAAGPASPESLKSLVLRTARTARPPISDGASPETRRYGDAIGDRVFVECAPGIRWAVAGDDGMTLAYRIVSPPACESTHTGRYLSTKVGIVLEGSLTISYPDGTSQVLGAWDAYIVGPGIVHSQEFHERTLVFEVYTPNNLDYEERYRRQVSGIEGCHQHQLLSCSEFVRCLD